MAIEQCTQIGIFKFRKDLRNNKVRDLCSMENQEMRMLQVKSPHKLVLFYSTNGSPVVPQETLSEEEINHSARNLTNNIFLGFFKRTYSYRP